jgi:hypothetical protein
LFFRYSRGSHISVAAVSAGSSPAQEDGNPQKHKEISARLRSAVGPGNQVVLQISDGLGEKPPALPRRGRRHPAWCTGAIARFQCASSCRPIPDGKCAPTHDRGPGDSRRVGCRLVIPVGTSSATGTRLLPTNWFRPRPPCGRSGDSTKHQPSPTAPTYGWTGCRMPLQILSAGSGIQHPLRHYDNPYGLYPCLGLPASA